MIFEGPTGVNKRIYGFNWFQLQMSKNEKEIREFEMDFKKSFL